MCIGTHTQGLHMDIHACLDCVGAHTGVVHRYMLMFACVATHTGVAHRYTYMFALCGCMYRVCMRIYIHVLAEALFLCWESASIDLPLTLLIIKACCLHQTQTLWEQWVSILLRRSPSLPSDVGMTGKPSHLNATFRVWEYSFQSLGLQASTSYWHFSLAWG